MDISISRPARTHGSRRSSSKTPPIPITTGTSGITAECYGPNSASRIFDAENQIAEITNNYGRISFNFGPTLLSWLQHKEPEVYQAILDADRESAARYSGHGSAVAQAYNHMILPLASGRDKRTQVRWGIGDFKFRFGRKPEGMWLPETAVDNESLQVLVEEGIRYTILSPYQAMRFRERGKRSWREASGGRIDPTMPYECRLAGGRSIAIFFYDGPISQGVGIGLIALDGRRRPA
jgi:alpha-amylase/alpha-mannosidase (GH57 family)